MSDKTEEKKRVKVVKIKIHKTETESSPVTLQVSNREMTDTVIIPRGKVVEVPEYFVDVLRNSESTEISIDSDDNEASPRKSPYEPTRFKEEKVPRFPHEVYE